MALLLSWWCADRGIGTDTGRLQAFENYPWELSIWGVSRQLPQRAARKPQIVLFQTHVYDTKMDLKNCLISISDVFFLQLSNDVGSFSENFHFDLQKLFRILFLAENISGTLRKIFFPT